MVRLPRMYSIVEDGIYHVIARGNKKANIFQDDSDYFVWKKYLIEYKEKYKIKILAYCLMENHFHLLIQSGKRISRFMGTLNSRYAMYFNSKYNQSGHLFQGRYKSFLVADDPYLITLIKYIHNNPVRANKVDYPNQYRHSSFNEYLNGKGAIDFNLVSNLFEWRKGGTPLYNILS